MATIMNMANKAKKSARHAKNAAIVTAAAFSIAMQAADTSAALQAAMSDMNDDGDKAIIVDLWDDFNGLIA